MTTNNNTAATVKLARELQAKREAWKARLDALTMPSADFREFPYASMDAAIADGFGQLFGGKEEAFRLLVKGYKTRAWRKAADKNRVKRDKLAEAKKPASK